jgi:hypothetical protein
VAKTKEILGFNLRTVLLGAGSLAVGVGIHAWLRTTQAAVERISVGFAYTAGFAVIGVVTYISTSFGRSRRSTKGNRTISNGSTTH